MATQPLGPDSGRINHAPVPDIGFAPMPAVARILAGFSPDQLGSFIEVAIGLLDVADPDPDEPDYRPRSDGLPGDPDDTEPSADRSDQAWIEWDTRGRHKAAFGGEVMARSIHGQILHEDAEDDDPAEEDDPSGQCDEDEVNTLQWLACGGGPGCNISDPGGCEHDGQERECMIDDVPMLPVYSFDHNIFNDKRAYLGLSNLTASFRGVARSADTGAEHNGRGDVREPGIPI